MTRAAGPNPVFALITGGGTGGHVYPALALAHELTRRGHPPESIRFVGAERGLEARAVPKAGFGIDLLPGRGLRRSLSVTNLRAALESLVALFKAFRIVGRLRPRVVVGVGGYASLPTLVAARMRRVPTVVHEQNAAPGLANRIAVRLGARPAVSLPDTPLRGAVLTGNPVRHEILGVDRHVDPSRPVVTVVGGSLGARRLNDTALGLYDRWRDREDLRIRHVSGPGDYDRCAERLADLRRPDDALDYGLVRYEERMDELYSTTSLALSRAGAVTVAELLAAGVPSVLVPFPAATADHQERNARVVASAGAALMVADEDCEADRIGPLASELLAQPARLEAMSRAAGSIARRDAAERLADLVEESAHG